MRLEASGLITLTYGRVASAGAIIGVSRGGGVTGEPTTLGDRTAYGIGRDAVYEIVTNPAALGGRTLVMGAEDAETLASMIDRAISDSEGAVAAG